jgi:hypothetical protein
MTEIGNRVICKKFRGVMRISLWALGHKGNLHFV